MACKRFPTELSIVGASTGYQCFKWEACLVEGKTLVAIFGLYNGMPKVRRMRLLWPSLTKGRAKDELAKTQHYSMQCHQSLSTTV